MEWTSGCNGQDHNANVEKAAAANADISGAAESLDSSLFAAANIIHRKGSNMSNLIYHRDAIMMGTH